MTLLLSAWKWFAIPPAVALATAAGAALVGSGGPGGDPPGPGLAPASPTAPVAAAGDPASSPVEVNVGSMVRTQANPGATVRGQSMTLRGKVSRLSQTVEQLRHSDPNAAFELRLSGGGIEYQGAADPADRSRAVVAPTPPGAKPPGPAPELTVELVGPAAVPLGKRIEYKVVVINPTSAAVKLGEVRVSLPREGGKLPRGPLPAGAVFELRNRDVVWNDRPQLESGQVVEHQFSYETTNPGQYRCTVDVDSIMLQPVDELVTRSVGRRGGALPKPKTFQAVDELVTRVDEPALTKNDPEPAPTELEVKEKPPVAVPPVTIERDSRGELGTIPADYFNPPAADPSQPGSPRPVQIGQILDIEVLVALPGRPITGERAVRPDGTISLGFYGDLYVVGLNRDQIKAKLLEKLRVQISDSALGLVGRKGEDPERVVAIPLDRNNRVFVDDQPTPSRHDDRIVVNPAEPAPRESLQPPPTPPSNPASTPPTDGAVVPTPAPARAGRAPFPNGPDGKPQIPGAIEDPAKRPVAVPPVVIGPDGHAALGNVPANYFRVPTADPSQPGSLQPVRVGQAVRVEVLEALPGRPITGERVVRPDGTISLGFYGDLAVAGLNRDQIKVELLEKLRQVIGDSTLGLVIANGPDHNRIEAVPPLQSNRVFVDDQPGLPARTLAGKAPKLAVAPEPRPARAPIPVRVGQMLVVEVLEALPGRPITGERAVRPDGTISLGFYGDLAVLGLTRDEIKVKVVERLRRFLADETLGLLVPNPRTNQLDAVPPARSDRVFVDDTDDYDPAAVVPPAGDGKVRLGQLLVVEVLQALQDRPITGERLVRPDGTIGLGFYGDLSVVGLTRGEIKAKVIEHLRAKLTEEQLGLVRVLADGSKQAINPAQSDRVFVDEVAPRQPASGSRGRDEQLQAQVTDLAGKLEAALAAIEQLRRERDGQKPESVPAPPAAPLAKPPTPAPPAAAKPAEGLLPIDLPPGADAARPVDREPPAVVAQDQPVDAAGELDRLLAAWTRRNAQMQTIQAVFERADKSPKWGTRTTQGVLLRNGPDQACLEFKRVISAADGKPRRKLNARGEAVLDVEREPFQRIVCTGKEILQYEWDEKAVHVYPTEGASTWSRWVSSSLADFAKFSLLFPIDTTQARQRYEWRMIGHDDQEWRVELVPRDPNDRKDFRSATIWLDKATLLPSRMVLIPAGGQDIQEFRFTRIIPNVAIAGAYFEPRTDLPGWTTNLGGGLPFAPPPALVSFLSFWGNVLVGGQPVP